MAKNSISINELVEQHVEFANSIAKKFMKKLGVSPTYYDELRSSAYIGLMDAATRWVQCKEEDRAKFKYFAFFRVKGAIIDSLRKDSAIGEKFYKYIKAYGAVADLEQNILSINDEDKEDEKIAKVFDLVSKGALVFKLSKVNDSFDNYEDTDAKNPDELLEEKERKEKIRKVIKKLEPREQKVIQAYYFEDKTFQEIADETGEHSKSWIARLHAKALKNLQELLNEG